MGVVSRVKVLNGEYRSNHNLMQVCPPKGRKQAANIHPNYKEPYLRLFVIWMSLPNKTKSMLSKKCHNKTHWLSNKGKIIIKWWVPPKKNKQ